MNIKKNVDILFKVSSMLSTKVCVVRNSRKRQLSIALASQKSLDSFAL